MKKASLFSILAIIAMIALSGAVFAQTATIHYKGADQSPALRVYNGSTEALSIVIQTGGAGAANTVAIGTTTNTVDGSGDIDTIAEFAAAIVACTNAVGAKPLTVDADCSLGTDSTDGELLSGTYTAAAGKWLEIPWDTSECKFYSIYLPDNKVNTARFSKINIKSVFGTATGTGAGTLGIYLNGSLAWQKALPEPSALNPTNAAVTVLSNVLDLPVDVNIPANVDQAVIVRLTRATTATTGMIGVVTE
jgi:hypothetical protein